MTLIGDVNGRPRRRSTEVAIRARSAPRNRACMSALLQKVIRIFHTGSLLEMSCCGPREHRVDCGEQIHRDGSFENKSIGARVNRRQLRVLFLVDAERSASAAGKDSGFGELTPAHLRVVARDQPRQ